jgi:hypothetical protein
MLTGIAPNDYSLSSTIPQNQQVRESILLIELIHCLLRWKVVQWNNQLSLQDYCVQAKELHSILDNNNSNQYTKKDLDKTISS